MKRNDKTVDLRIIKTKKAIRDAFLALIEEKGFERISVKEITETPFIFIIRIKTTCLIKYAMI